MYTENGMASDREKWLTVFGDVGHRQGMFQATE